MLLASSLPGLLLSIISLSEIIRAEGSHPVQFPGAIPSYEGKNFRLSEFSNQTFIRSQSI